MSQNYTQIQCYRKTGTPEIHTDLHCHVTMTQKCPVTQPELVTDTGTIRHALSEKALYCPRNETQNLSQEATQTLQKHTHTAAKADVYLCDRAT